MWNGSQWLKYMKYIPQYIQIPDYTQTEEDALVADFSGQPLTGPILFNTTLNTQRRWNGTAFEDMPAVTLNSTGGGGSSAWADITDKPAVFPPDTHIHAQADVTNLITDLGNKANASHAHTVADTTGLQTALDGKSATGHTHANDHARQHSVTSTSDHTFPGGGTTFLRDDGTFTAPPGGNDPRILTVRKTANQAITGAIGNVTDMALSLAADTTYYVYVTIPVTTSTGTSPTLQLGFTGPASPTLVHLRRIQMTSATATAFAVITSFTTFAAGASVANTMHTIEGIVRTSVGNAGTLQLRAAAAGTTPSITIPAGASMYAIKTS